MNIQRLSIFFFLCLMASCDLNSDIICKKDISNGVARIFSLVHNKNETEVSLARENLRNIMNRCGVPEDGITVPMLGDFTELQLLIFSYDENKFVQYLNNKKLKDIKLQNISTPIHSAAFYGSKNMVELLLGMGFDVNAKDIFSNTPLMVAVQGFQKNFENSDILLSNGADVNYENKYGISALDWAIINEDVETVSYLLNHGAIIDCAPAVGPSTLEIAKKTKNKEIIKLLGTRSDACK